MSQLEPDGRLPLGAPCVLADGPEGKVVRRSAIQDAGPGLSLQRAFAPKAKPGKDFLKSWSRTRRGLDPSTNEAKENP